MVIWTMRLTPSSMDPYLDEDLVLFSKASLSLKGPTVSSGSHFNESRLQTKECDHPTRIPWTCFTGFIRCRLSRSAKMHPEEMQLLRTDGRLYHSVDMINLVDAIHLPVESRAFHATGKCTGSSQTNVSVLHAAGFGFEGLDLLGARPVSHPRSATRSQVS